MSFGGFGNNNNNTSTGFGGFGSGSTGGFGSNNTANTGSLFGGGASTTNTTSGGFGAGGGGFGANNTSSGFGAKPVGAFGTTTTATTSGGSLFGGNTSTSGGFGGGGFGATNNASSGFGGGNTGGGIFGASKPATGGFGGGTTTGNSIFGGGGTSGGFGSNNANTTASNPFTANTGNAGNTGFGANNANNTSTGFGGFGQSNAAASNNGTAGTQFTPFTEKDGTSNQTSHYQSITFQQPYQNKSFEELRTEDYLQGRRYGNSNGQPGSFGASTGFGGSIFGGANNNTTTNTSTGGGLFGGSNTNATTGTATFGSAFGANNNANTNTGGFGNNSGGSLFGNKPAGGSIFGGAQSSGTTTGGFGGTSGSTGGLFGSGGSGFGANNNQQQQPSGGLFGNNNQQQQNKPAFGGFGASNNNTGGFGNNTNTGGLFGSSTAQNTNTGGGIFGAANNQQQSNPFGGSTDTGGSLFGNTQNKPASGGLFGSNTNNNTGGGLFGSNNNNQQQQQQQSGGLFGNTTNTNTGGGLFGNNNQNKPAGGSLFGGSTTNTNPGNSLFGNNQQQQPNTGLFGGNANSGNSLFGGNNQNKPAGNSLFGNTNTSNTGGGLFGSLGQNNQQNQQNNSGMFGSLGQSNQNQQNSSVFGNSMSQNQPPQQNQLHASLTVAPYGNDQLFQSLPGATPVGPLATPLSGAKPAQPKTPSLLSSTRLNSPIYTPRAGSLNRTGTYGFSYSTYGTPGSAFSASLTPQQSSLLKPTGSLGSALTSRLAKSMSMNNLRGDSTSREGESLLRPTPGSASSKYLQSGSMRKLIIDRNIRADLFAPPEQQKQLEAPKGSAEVESPGLTKKVSFDNSAERSTTEPGPSNALIRTEEPVEQESPPSLFRAAANPRSQTNTLPEMQQVNGSSLNTVMEDGEAPRSSSIPATKKASSKGAEIGDYWTKPAIKDLKNMSRTQLSKLGKFTVGREGVGRIEFGPCDLTNSNLDEICGKICVFKLRSVTVYPEEATKPPMGKGLNVPATIYLENSWPRSHGGRRAVFSKTGPAYEKHLARLKSTVGTTFKDYDADTGVWTFTVEHFTTYGLEEDDDEGYTDDMDIQQNSSALSEPPESEVAEDDTMQSMETGTGEVDDTFEFKTLKTHSRADMPGRQVPGGFDEPDASYMYEEASSDEDSDENMMRGGLREAGIDDDPFALSGGGAVRAPSPGAVERYHSSMALDDEPGAVDIAEDKQIDHEPPLPGSFIAEEPLNGLRSILKPTTTFSAFPSPEKLAAESWEEQLHRTMSPKKRDRQVLRDLQQSVLREQNDAPVESPLKRTMMGQSVLDQSELGQSYLAQKSAKKIGSRSSAVALHGIELGTSQAFRTSMDIMNSLWAEEKATKTKGTGAVRRFQNPYHKKPRLSASAELDEDDAAFHNSMKPSFANNGMIVYSVDGSARQVIEPLVPALQPLVGEHKETRFARWSTPRDINTDTLTAQKDATSIDIEDGFPFAKTDVPTTVFLSIATLAKPEKIQERAAWELADILFDTVTTACGALIENMPPEQVVELEPRLRKDAFSALWIEMLGPAVNSRLSYANSAEEKALLHLTRNDISAACEVLADAKDFKLATMIAQLPGTEGSRELMRAQIRVWRDRNDWSEMPDAIRALYSILAGEVCTVEGKSGPPENRISSFCISEHFGLSWGQSFALRVFFGGYNNLNDAIQAYLNDLTDGRERVLPRPAWAEDTDVEDEVEDTLLGLLRVKVSKATADTLFDPKTVSGSSANSRLAWQLATFLRAKGYIHDLSNEKLDRLTLSFAAELEAAQVFVTAAWVLLHLSNSATRQKAVSDLLYRHARDIDQPITPGSEEYGNWEHLTGVLLIPPELLWAAKAQYARAVLDDACLQTKYLLQANAADEAHEVLCTIIGPRAIIEEDYEALTEVLSFFQDHRVDGWEEGGQIFSDFATLVTLPTSRKHKQEGRQVMERLAMGLQAMENGERSWELEAQVALIEMQKVLKEEMSDFNASGHGIEVGGLGGGMDGVEKAGELGGDAFARYQEAMGVLA